MRCVYDLRGAGRQHGQLPAGRRDEGQAHGAAEQRDHDPSAAWRYAGAGVGYQDPRGPYGAHAQ